MATVSQLPQKSIQGEQQEQYYDTLWASDEAVAEWVDDADEGFVICRERARHGYRRVKRGERLSFVAKTKTGFYVRRELCPDCKAVQLVELYALRPKKGTKNIIAEAERVLSYPVYVNKAYLGKPGFGRMKPGKVRDAIVSHALAGVDIRELEQEIEDYEAQHTPAVSA